MRVLTRIGYHLHHLSYTLGRKRVLGSERFRMHGYFPNRFSSDGTDEQSLRVVIKDILGKTPGAFIDVGANVGQSFCHLLAIDRTRQYVGFEPQIACCFYLDQFIRDNDLRNAEVLPVALGDASGFARLAAAGTSDLMASIVGRSPQAIETDYAFTTVPVVIGDDAIDQLALSAISIIKIDAEGAELAILRGLQRTLRKYRPALIFEVLPNYMLLKNLAPFSPEVAMANTESSTAIWDLLTAAGYTIMQIDDDGGTRCIDRFLLDDPTQYVGRDYLAVPMRLSPTS